MDVINLTKELVNIPSPSGSEREIGNFLVQRLNKNFNVKIQKVGNRFNIIATKGVPKLILTTHMDTVPKQIKADEDNNWIYGRGSCDTKGIIACMICASEEAIKLGYSNFGLLFDVSEETDFSGIKKAVKLINTDYIVIGEPTNFKTVIGQKGLIQLKIQCYGKSAPGSTPEIGISAINNLVEIIHKIKGIKFPHDRFLGKTTLNIGKINGGSSPNVVADYAEATIEIRTTKANSTILDILRKVIPKKNLKIIYSYGAILNKNTDFINKFRFDKITVPYFTEMYFLHKKGKSLVFGPGKYEFAHSENEKIKKKDLSIT